MIQKSLKVLLLKFTAILLIGSFFSLAQASQWSWHWQMTNSVSATMTLSNKDADGYYPLRYSFSDGSERNYSLQLKLVNGEKRLYKLGDEYGSYFVVQKDRSLDAYDQDGFIHNLSLKK